MNDVEIDAEFLQDNLESWAHAESITYISNLAANGQSKLCTAYSTIFPGLMTMLYKKLLLKISLPIIDLNSKFSITFQSSMSAMDTPSVLKGETFQDQQPLTAMNQGFLHHLRPLHSVIDAAGVLQASDQQYWLLMI